MPDAAKPPRARSHRAKSAAGIAKGPDGKAAARKESRTEAARQLAQEIEALRTTCKEILQAYELHVGAELAAVVDRLRVGAPSGSAKLPSLEKLAAALVTVRAVKLKPKKGRVKDLARLQRLAEELASDLAGET